MNFWNLLGLANKKDVDEISQKISAMIILIENVRSQTNNAIESVDDHINIAFEKTLVQLKRVETDIQYSNTGNTSNIISLLKNTNKDLANNLNSIDKELNKKLTTTIDFLKTLITNDDTQMRNNIMNQKKLNQKIDTILQAISESMENIISNVDIKAQNSFANQENVQQKLDDILEVISENKEIITLKTHLEIKEEIFVINNAISKVISILDKNVENNAEKLENIEILFSKLLETIKIIWVNDMLNEVANTLKKDIYSK